MSLILLLQSAPPAGSWTGLLLAFGTTTAAGYSNVGNNTVTGNTP